MFELYTLMAPSRNGTIKRAEITYFLAEKRQTLWAYFKSMQLHITILTVQDHLELYSASPI